jgi:hypothetical protein
MNKSHSRMTSECATIRELAAESRAVRKWLSAKNGNRALEIPTKFYGTDKTFRLELQVTSAYSDLASSHMAKANELSLMLR